MTKQEFIELRKRLETFAEKAGKEAHDDEDIQKLAEGCIWIGAVWLARNCNIKVIENAYKERYKRISESEWFKKHYEDKSLGDTIEIKED